MVARVISELEKSHKQAEDVSMAFGGKSRTNKPHCIEEVHNYHWMESFP